MWMIRRIPLFGGNNLFFATDLLHDRQPIQLGYGYMRYIRILSSSSSSYSALTIFRASKQSEWETTYAAPDRPLHNFKALKSENREILSLRECRSTDFEVPKLWKGRSVCCMPPCLSLVWHDLAKKEIEYIQPAIPPPTSSDGRRSRKLRHTFSRVKIRAP